jgi:tetrahydromethanopterin S-methyltransferase subunit D
VFDPLLFRRHRDLYRRHIEVKRVFGVTIHRPLHYVALGDVAAAVLVVAGIALGSVPLWATGAGLMLLAGTAFRFRYQGWRALHIYRPAWTTAFLVLPLVYVWSLLRGCIRYRTFGPMI